MSGANQELKKLFETSTITLPGSGIEVNIKKVTLRTLQPVTDLISRVFADLQLDAANMPSVDLQSPAFILKLISKYYTDITKIVVSMSSLGEDEFLDMEASDSVVVVQAVAMLNKDFFMNRVLPNLKLLQEEDPQAPTGQESA